MRNLKLLDTEPEPFFDELIRLASVVADTPMAAFTLVDRDRQWFKAKIGIEVSETPRADAFCAHTIMDPFIPFIVPNAEQSEIFRDNPLVTSNPNIRSYAGFPINSPDYELTIGTLCVIDTSPREFSNLQLKLLSEISVSLARAVKFRSQL